MTSLRRKPIALGTRRNTIEQEREHFQKYQEASFRKAINEDEIPIKMKHIRNLIIGTHTDHNGAVFWGLVALSPPLHSDVTAWKFCYTLHLILRDGHAIALKDSIQHMGRVRNLGEHFKHLPGGYGLLIQKYCALLLCKLQFHQHNPGFPGNLQVKSEQLEAIAENDPNNYFELAVEMLEYMEKILKLYEVVFDSLDPSRANSMTRTGQCRLSPLIPCIQDSSSLYDFIVRILFKLHKMVSLDMLSGHRMRFNQQFKILHNFYNNTRNLQYFKTLIQVPHLPQVPPNFLIEAELGSHVAPVVVLEEEQPDPQESVLVDTTDPSPPPVPPHPHPDAVNPHNGAMMEVLAERDSLIEALQEELRECRNVIQTLRSEQSFIEERLKLKITDLESTLAERESELSAEKQSKDSVLAQVEAAAASAEAVTKLSDEESRRRSAEDKFAKMKEVYQKLRDEHINLIRMKADLEKTLSEEKRRLAEEQDRGKKRESMIHRMEVELQEQRYTQRNLEDVNKDKMALETELSALADERDEMAMSKEALQMALSELEDKLEQQGEQMQVELSNAVSTHGTNMDQCLASAVDSSISYIKFSLSHFDSEVHRINKCTPEYTLLYRDPSVNAMNQLLTSYDLWNADSAQPAALISSVAQVGYFVASFLVHAKASSHLSPHLDTAENLVSSLESLAKDSMSMLDKIGQKVLKQNDIVELISQINKCCELIRSCEDLTPSLEDMAGTLEREMEAMNGAIGEAVERFSLLLEQSRAKDTGTQLEVNEGILGTCGELMTAVRLLVQRASELQREIVASGKGGASPREFYKRNHRWTEGLISGAKTVAIGCKALVEAADDVVTGRGKFEQVIVASKEIAASSIQLVMSSRVKANKESQKLANLNAAAKTISTLTGTVVATAESCREKVSDAASLDFSKLSLHSAKMLEMETLVKVLETEKQLENERKKLSELRRHHYQLAGAVEGWDEEDIPK